MNQAAKKIILHSQNRYETKHDEILQKLINEKILLFCTVGKDCELLHDIMDELIVGNGTTELDFDLITTWHPDETIEEVIEYCVF